MGGAQAGDTVLDVKGLETVFFTNSGLFRAVDGVSFHVKRGKLSPSSASPDAARA